MFLPTPRFMTYDESREVYEFESIEKAISFVEEDLKKTKQQASIMVQRII